MTRKHFRAIAEAVVNHWRATITSHMHTPSCVCNNLADVFAKENPRFRRDLFLTACLPEEEQEPCATWKCPGPKHGRFSLCGETQPCAKCQQPKDAHRPKPTRTRARRNTRTR